MPQPANLGQTICFVFFFVFLWFSSTGMLSVWTFQGCRVCVHSKLDSVSWVGRYSIRASDGGAVPMQRPLSYTTNVACIVLCGSWFYPASALSSMIWCYWTELNFIAPRSIRTIVYDRPNEYLTMPGHYLYGNHLLHTIESLPTAELILKFLQRALWGVS